jgi:BirA family biotin operon repressor/biotin-[acetyl-CoA-carboxylase] ligase
MVARPRVPAGSIAPVTLAVGAALARMLEARLGGRAPVWLKWPNDLLAGPRGQMRKLGGVLVEGQLRGSEVASVVIGVGLNVGATAFPEEIAGRATSLAMLGTEAAALDRSAIAAGMLAAIEEAVARFEEARLSGFLPDIARMDALRGASVEVGEVRGVAEGIDAEGRLLVRAEDGAVARVVTGEVRW